ncbi:hypothetical protein FOA52_010892 [Chlamydomonas sp. UWO 241]|nr:hypothetical protein FOA52_010892 [Chlamydomonas sp. UWO 241]
MRRINCCTLLLAAAVALRCVASNDYDWNWHEGRATRYGNLDDPWTIHYGSCGYYYLDADVATGWDIAALGDSNWGYNGQCGICFEVACSNMAFTDGYGSYLDRNDACYDSSASVVVQITDSCQCKYPSNAYSNKRWPRLVAGWLLGGCCVHADAVAELDPQVLLQLAASKWGVIGIKFRQVPCSYQPEKKAVSDNPSPGYGRPTDWKRSDDRRPWS